ncbi:aspartyl-phosphate phosphatase Spo0E family protein [Clostridium pasteurianum]|uniref:Spo0E like sporulation regulatory protein n=1 Tax=Clostridium pasteurianum BC1 TaxID=86416 RepID=R4K454_CLOPA|nr:aspartyl-phosphate phosphatase Spo0E family protein [Clostridium pasteurianum]AGK97363.1 Spo0E like sporulation regulatory protein [Clostridium pasteurianum BC1]
MCKKLEKLRDKLNRMLDSDKYTYEEILEVSQKLDKLVVDYYKSHENQI